jgi:hypothetical protein
MRYNSFRRGLNNIGERGKRERFGWFALPGSPLLPSRESVVSQNILPQRV